jgi:hypothetical protein
MIQASYRLGFSPESEHCLIIDSGEFRDEVVPVVDRCLHPIAATHT